MADLICNILSYSVPIFNQTILLLMKSYGQNKIIYYILNPPFLIRNNYMNDINIIIVIIFDIPDRIDTYYTLYKS